MDKCVQFETSTVEFKESTVEMSWCQIWRFSHNFDLFNCDLSHLNPFDTEDVATIPPPAKFDPWVVLGLIIVYLRGLKTRYQVF